MSRMPPPEIPEGPVPVQVAPVLDIQRRARFWARLSTVASVLVAIGAILLALQGTIPWWAAILLVAIPYLPLAAETRIVELRDKLELQVIDVQAAQRKEEWTKGKA